MCRKKRNENGVESGRKEEAGWASRTGGRVAHRGGTQLGNLNRDHTARTDSSRFLRSTKYVHGSADAETNDASNVWLCIPLLSFAPWDSHARKFIRSNMGIKDQSLSVTGKQSTVRKYGNFRFFEMNSSILTNNFLQTSTRLASGRSTISLCICKPYVWGVRKNEATVAAKKRPDCLSSCLV